MSNHDFLRLVEQIYQAELAWIGAKEKSDTLEEQQKAVLDEAKNNLAKQFPGDSDSKLTRMAQGSAEHMEYIANMVMAKSKTLRAKAHLNKLEREFEARRSIGAYEREKLKQGITYQGRG